MLICISIQQDDNQLLQGHLNVYFSLALFDVLREPPKAFTKSHLADNTAHEHLQRAHIGVSQTDVALARREVRQAHMVTQLILRGSIRGTWLGKKSRCLHLHRLHFKCIIRGEPQVQSQRPPKFFPSSTK
ncbi:GTP-binding protein SAR1A [Senna tora]|uniref:GTP-binding protein SAR1A n=1 Tax=Senna tora TaxID=362788 RepID=A0A834X395_9FABA|nr:GTP-binding protein SAR1A [Senna tora]